MQVVAAPGSYGTSTTYTILNATGGVTGTYSGVSSNFAFLTPSLSYDANNVFLTLALQGNAFSGFGGNTVNQRSVGSALDQSFAGATGDFATVIGALAGLSTAQAGPALERHQRPALCRLRLVQRRQQRAVHECARPADGAGARRHRGGGQRQALAEACDVAACDGASPFSVWGSALGGLGSRAGRRQRQHVHLQRRRHRRRHRLSPDPSFLVGLSAGYTNGTQWVDSFQGKGWSNTVSVAAYGCFTQWRLLRRRAGGLRLFQQPAAAADPDPRPAAAHGQRLSTGANQFLAQVETGYAIAVYPPAAATLTPFARFQASSINQAAFSEWGANSLSLNLAQQTTTSLRTMLGADLAGSPRARRHAHARPWPAAGLAARIRRHGRPITAAFAGAPVGQLHRLRRHAAARRRGDRLPGQHQRRRRHARSTCATTARSARAPTTTRSISVCASAGRRQVEVRWRPASAYFLQWLVQLACHWSPQAGVFAV